ncbi:type 2 isopentenyl-diphosphate Delta-isomerase [Alicyclobacillus vulcanalis]|uniref:Isopentenyl-diphosphate delta-isomerase n=1 Tax=Alicyclobacillus vulcanalis TaxID=252246 RepID=A0A1N7JVT2_9BACL|nr:type 2 isopentenyl-diphosphate Delta-isomerase [Alicyclobacillus vulcanalis]SIS53459.1 isopentenyl-diphosphate delta-isomerase [Alicyclobacillus vulcanalis]
MTLTQDIRQRRKVEHVQAVQALGDPASVSSGFECVELVPCAVPEVAWDDVSLATEICGVRLESPIIINAMTGGADEVYDINRRLAQVARRFGLAMALGSASAGLASPEVAYTYRVVREIHEDGIVIANVGMGTRLERARQAVELVGANLLQVHFNAAQELFMAEGDRDFRGALEALAEVAHGVGVPVVAKEVGQGISAEDATRFADAGVRAIDVGGLGGTNFIAVEAWRRGVEIDEFWSRWGLRTAAAVCEVQAAAGHRVDVIASGGIRTALDVAKAMALGARAVGIAGPLVRMATQADGEAQLNRFMEELHFGLRALLVLTGCRNFSELRGKPVVILGWLREWLEARGLAAWMDARGRAN